MKNVQKAKRDMRKTIKLEKEDPGGKTAMKAARRPESSYFCR